MNHNFNDLDWHDANLKSIFIDRENPGKSDTIKLVIKWSNDLSLTSVVEFYDCYAIQANMNLGVVADETILSAECINESDELDDIKKRWLKMGVNLINLNKYLITTSSTNSTISIFSLGFRIIH